MAFVPFRVRGPCPVPPETRVRPLYRSMEEGKPIEGLTIHPAKNLRWDKFPNQSEPLPFDIIGYEVVR